MDSLTGSQYAYDDAPAPDASNDAKALGLESILAGAVELARDAIEAHSGDSVGEYLGCTFEDSTAATHRFLANLPGYRGWQWAVVVAAYPGADHATVSEVVLVPGPTALLAPQWVPWEERVKPGDLSPGDLLAPAVDDPRLVPGYTATGDPELDDTAVELGLGRRQVLSPLGRADAAERWHDGDFGPGSAMARGTRRVCRDCGFLLPLAGALRTMFGVCANEMAADGHVVDLEYGCGAHSDTPAPQGTGSPLFDPYDDGVLDVTSAPQQVEPVAEVVVTEAPVAEQSDAPVAELPEASVAEQSGAPVAEDADGRAVEQSATPDTEDSEAPVTPQLETADAVTEDPAGAER